MGSDRRTRRPHPRRLCALLCPALVVLGVTVVAAPGHAQPAAEAQPALRQPSVADKETARSLMDEGVDREEVKDYAAALKAYEGAHALVGLPMTGVAVARMQAQVGLLLEALDRAVEVKLMPKKPGESAAYARARKEAAALADALPARIPAVQVLVSGAPEPAVIEIDGAVLPAAAADLPRKLNPGRHVITASAPGFEKVSVEVEVSEGATLAVRLALKPVEADRKKAGGEKVIEPVKPEGRSISPLVYIGFGVGAAGIVAGTIAGIDSLSRTSNIQETLNGNCSGDCRRTTDDEIARANTTANISNISFAVGLVGVATGVVGLVLSGDSDEDSKTPSARSAFRVRPTVMPGGIALTGTF